MQLVQYHARSESFICTMHFYAYSLMGMYDQIKVGSWNKQSIWTWLKEPWVFETMILLV
jgi:hypothetical protein